MRKLFSGNVLLPAATATSVGQWDVSECESLGIDLKNLGANAVTAFQILGKASPEGDFVTLVSGGYTASGWWTRWANVEPASLAAGAAAMVQLTVEELSAVQIVITSTAGTTLKINVVAWEHAR